jgi:hypothetical protein
VHEPLAASSRHQHRSPLAHSAAAIGRRTSLLAAAVLCAFIAGTAALSARAIHEEAEKAAVPHRPVAPARPPRGPSSHESSPPPARLPDHRLAVYPGPLPVPMVARAIAWWNSAGADVELVLTNLETNADIVIGPFRRLGGNAIGVTDTPCAAPCRPDGTETINLSPRTDYNRLTTLVHELGHALGLAHSHVHTCSVMAPNQGDGCPSDQLPLPVPQIDRAALIQIWGVRPTRSNR